MRYYAGIGSRETPKDICDVMTDIAIRLSRKNYTLRSGGAKGADLAFEAGAGEAKEIYLPWKKHNGSLSKLYNISESALKLAEKMHPSWNNCSYTARQFHARNGYQVLGYDIDNPVPVDFVVCWTLAGTDGGGTGQALRIARSMNIPVYNLFYTIERIALDEFILSID